MTKSRSRVYTVSRGIPGTNGPVQSGKNKNLCTRLVIFLIRKGEVFWVRANVADDAGWSPDASRRARRCSGNCDEQRNLLASPGIES
jgi:hypothetical protein